MNKTKTRAIGAYEGKTETGLQNGQPQLKTEWSTNNGEMITRAQLT
jgi:hypothetical protein